MQRIRILYVITKLELGGAQKQLLSLIRELDKNKFEPFLFTAANGLLVKEAQSINGLALYLSRSLDRNLNPIKDFLSLIEIIRFIKRNNIQIVHTHSSKAGIIGRLAAKCSGIGPVVHTAHGWSFNDYQPYLLRKFFILLERLTCRFTGKIIVVSNHDKLKGLANHVGSQDKYGLIRYAVNHKEFSISAVNARKEFGLSDKDLVVGMIACFKPQKSPENFIKLAYLVNQSLPGTKFVLVGDGALRGKLEKLILEYKLGREVILTGWREDIRSILSGLDVFVLTSRWEGLPVTVLEAMAAGLPVVATNTGGVSEIISEGKTGYLVLPNDAEAMSKKVVELLKNIQLRDEIGKSSPLIFEKGDFSLINVARDTEQIYASLFKGGD